MKKELRKGEHLTKQQKNKYIWQTIEAGFIVTFGILLFTAIIPIMKIWRGQTLGEWDIFIIIANMIMLVMRNSTELFLFGIEELKQIKKRIHKRATKNIKTKKED